MPARSDEELYLQAAYREIYDRHSAPLFRFVYRFTLNRESAEEILQDVFTQLLSGKFRVEQTGALKSWLYTVAKNRCLNYLKAHSREVKHERSIEQALSPSNVEESQDAQDRQRGLRRAEALLPQDLRETWQLRKQGLNQEQIAQALSIPVGTVKSRFHRLIQHLKKEFTHDA